MIICLVAKQSNFYCRTFSSVLCCHFHLPPAVPDARNPHHFLQISLPGFLRSPSSSAALLCPCSACLAPPKYLAELCSPVSESANCGHLRSAARGDLAVPHSRTTRYGQRCLAVSGPTLWNSLPLSVRDPSLTLTQFCACLKTALFCRAYETLA